jgi:hypothetical protein
MDYIRRYPCIIDSFVKEFAPNAKIVSTFNVPRG